MKYRCKEPFAVPNFDGVETGSRNIIVARGEVFKKNDNPFRVAGGPETVRLENANGWLEIRKERFDRCFEPVYVADLSKSPLRKEAYEMFREPVRITALEMNGSEQDML